MLAVDYTADPEAVAAFAPEGFTPTGDGACTAVACDWASAADSDARLLADPELGQYHEVFIVLHGSFNGAPAGRVPFIWVDSEISLLRGLIQGFPKQLAAIHMTRPVTVGHGGRHLQRGSALRAHATSRGTRLIDLTVHLVEPTAHLPQVVLVPFVHTRLWPTLEASRPGVHELTTATITDPHIGTVWQGDGQLSLCPSDAHELGALAPVETGTAWALQLGFTVTGGTIHELPDAHLGGQP
jgi:acetoacetate decarboxylase